MSDQQRVITLFCPTCNMQVEARVLACEETDFTPKAVPLGEDLVIPLQEVVVVSFAVCKRCRQPFLVEERSCEVPGELSAPLGERVLYPVERPLVQDGVPECIAKVYDDAARAFAVGLYEPCVIMCRKGLEGVAIELGAKKGPLGQRLRELRASGKIDSRLAEWVEGLRLVGNDAAHDLEVRLAKEDARDSLEFLEALLSYTFTLTRRFDEFQARRGKGSQNQEGKDGS